MSNSELCAELYAARFHAAKPRLRMVDDKSSLPRAWAVLRVVIELFGASIDLY